MFDGAERSMLDEVSFRILPWHHILGALDVKYGYSPVPLRTMTCKLVHVVLSPTSRSDPGEGLVDFWQESGVEHARRPEPFGYQIHQDWLSTLHICRHGTSCCEGL